MAKLRGIIMLPNEEPPRIINKQGLRIAGGLSRKAGLRPLYEGIEIMGRKEYFERSEVFVIPCST